MGRICWQFIGILLLVGFNRRLLLVDRRRTRGSRAGVLRPPVVAGGMPAHGRAQAEHTAIAARADQQHTWVLRGNAYRTGEGVAVEGADAVEAQGDFNRPWLVGSFATEYLPQVPDVHEKLTAGAHVADISCGVGWAAISIARGYPATTVDGFDLDEPAIALARSNARHAGVADRVTFQARDAADPSLCGQDDLAVIVEALHDMSRPVAVLASVRRLLAGNPGRCSRKRGARSRRPARRRCRPRARPPGSASRPARVLTLGRLPD